MSERVPAPSSEDKTVDTNAPTDQKTTFAARLDAARDLPIVAVHESTTRDKKSAFQEMNKSRGDRVLHRIGDRIAYREDVDAEAEAKIGEVLEQSGFGEQYYFAESERGGAVLRLIIVGAAHSGETLAMLEGSFKTIREKIEDLEKVLKLIVSLDLGDRFKLVQSDDTKSENRENRTFEVIIFADKNQTTTENTFLGSPGAVWSQIKEKYDKPEQF